MLTADTPSYYLGDFCVTPPVIIFRNAIRDSEQLSSRARLVALVLSTYMDAHELTCYPSVPTIAKGAGYTKRKPVQLGLAELERVGAVHREIGGGNRPNHYRGVLPEEWNRLPDEKPVSDGEQVSRQDRYPVPIEQPPVPKEAHPPLPERHHELDTEQTIEQTQEQTDDDEEYLLFTGFSEKPRPIETGVPSHANKWESEDDFGF